MATLIQSKQIQGIVTASVITGEFLVSGSLVVTGSNSILGSVTASAISSSFIGDGSGITGIEYSQIGDTPQFVGGNNITITSSSNVITVHAQLDGTGSDSQNLSVSGDQLTILGGNTITIPTGSNISDYFELSNIPQGIVSSSIQILGGSGVLSGSKTDISSLNTFTSSIQTEVDGLSAVTSSYLTSSGSVDFSDVTNKPSLLSSSLQVTITESQISDLTHYTDSDVKTKLDTEGVISGSLVDQLPSGVISGSSQITITESQISDLDKYNDSDVKTKLDTEGVISGSSQITITESQISDLTHTEIPSGTISGSEQLPQGLISGSSQISITESQISDLDKYTDSDVQTYIDSIGIVSGSVVAELPSGTVSGSDQVLGGSGIVSGSVLRELPTGTVSGSSQITITESQISDLDKYTDSDVKTKLDVEGVVSGSVLRELPSGTVSGSSQISITESQISDLTHYGDSDVKAKLDTEGVVSGSYVQSLPSGTVSGSSQITITESQISDLDKYTDSDVKTKLDTEGVLSGSLIEQLPIGTISGSSQVTITESQISDLTHTDISSLNTFTSSIQTQVDGISSVTSSYLTSSGSVDFTDITSLPSGLVSGSIQITDGSGIVSSSQQVISHLPQGTVSGSAQTISNLPSGVVSGSFSSSMATAVELLNEVSGANYIESQSADSRLNTIEGSIGMYYDLSNTVWNQVYIKSGSNQASNTAGFETGNVPFVFKLNNGRKLNYNNGDIVYINNFDRDVTITAFVSGAYDTGSRQIGFNVVSINQQTGSYRINDSYWILSRHSAGFVDSASYIEASSSFDHRIDVIVASGSGANWNVNLTNIPQGIVSSSLQQYSASIDNGFALTSSLNEISNSLDTKIDNVFLSSSNFDNKTLVSGSEQIDLRNVTNYVADEHIDHTTVNINAGDGLDGGGDISSTREIRLNVTSSHFETGVTDILTAEGVVKQSTLDDDIVGTDFSQSVDNRINSISANSVPQGTVSGSTQVDIEQTQNYTAFSASIATSISEVDNSGIDTSTFATTGSNVFVGNQIVSGSIIPEALNGNGIHDLGSLSNPFGELYITTGSVRFVRDGELVSQVSGERDAIRVGNILITTSSLQIVSGSGDSLTTISTIASADVASDGAVSNTQQLLLPDGTVSGSDQVLGGTGIFSGSLVSGTNITINQDGNNFIISSSASGGVSSFDNLTDIPSGLVSGSSQITEISSLNTFTSSVDTRVTNLESFSSSLDATFATDSELTSLSSSLDSRIDSLETRTDFTGSDSQSLSIVGDQLTINGGNTVTIPTGSNVTSFDDLTNIPSGLVSESQQVILDDVDGFTAFSQSVDMRLDSAAAGNVPAGTVSSSQQVIDNLPDGTVSGSEQIEYDGDRTISNDKLGDLFTDSVNPGTSGSVIDFLNAVFYPNSAPSITTGNQTISEYTTNGSTIVTIVGTDPEGQTLTFGTSSAYTDDLVRVASNGVLTLNALAESSSFNTDSVGGVHGHKVEVTATDTFNTVTEKDIYIIVTPNEAPKFRETSVSGNVITSVTANLNESSADNTLVKRVFFTDTETDTITITTSSIDNEHFDIDIQSTYIDIRQNTGSLDYEQQTSYTFSVTASDSHYEDGDDLDSVTSLPITINVVDNLVPTINDQTLSAINENSSDGASVGTLSASDNEGDTITFTNFTLSRLELDSVEVSQGTYSGTSQLTDPHENPFQMDSSGNITRRTGVYLNSDLVNEYQYTVQVRDSYNGISAAATITIPISDDTPATLTDNWSAGPYIIESAESGDLVRVNSNGRSGTQADYGSNQSGTWSSSNSVISINSNGNLSLGSDVSGSYNDGDTISSTITFTNTFGTTTTDSLNVSVSANQAPTATFTPTSFNNTNQATGSANMVTVAISDDESDSPYQVTLSGTDASSFNAVPQNADSSSWEIQITSDLSATTYNYNITVEDNFGKSTSYNGRTLTVNSADDGDLVATDAYIIESATNGDLVRRNTNGRSGTQSSVAVSYSPSYGSPIASNFASSNALIDIDSDGRLSVGNDISGSGNVNGDLIATTISWNDQYGNNGSEAISVEVTQNFAPTVSSTQTFNTNTNQATGSANIVRLNLTDTEGDSIPASNLSWNGYNTTYFTPNNTTGQMNLQVNSTSVPAGTYPYTASIKDEHGFSTTEHSGSVTISQADTGTLNGDTAIYIIESAENGDTFRDQTGFNQGNAAQVSVTYSPSYGSPVLQSFTSSNEAIVVDSSGNLTLGLDISGSVTQSGDTFTSTITFDDQYGNVGSGSVTATVFGNSSPTANFTSSSLYDSDASVSGSDAGTLIVTDTENNSPFTITLAGTDGGKFDVSGSSSPFTIQPTGSLDADTYSFNITVTDSYGESVTLTNETIVVDTAEVLTTVYIYTSTRTGGGTLSDANYNALLGITSENTSTTPDTITGFQSAGPSPIFELKDGELGNSPITVGGGTMTLRGTRSGSNLDTIISSSINGDGSTAEQIMILFPSGSTLGGIPTSMTDSLGGSTTGEYALYLKAAGEASFNAAATQIHQFDVDTAVDGYSTWNIIGRNAVNTAATYELRMIPSSGSAPS